MYVSPKVKVGELFKHLLEKIISLDFLSLKVTFHLVAQAEIVKRSLFNSLAVSAGSNPDAIKDVSSAKINMWLSISLIVSLIYIIKSICPNQEPCGTPALTSNTSDLSPSTMTIKDSPEIYQKHFSAHSHSE